MSKASTQIHVINKCKVNKCSNIDMNNVSFGDDTKVDSSIFVPILYNKEQLFVQFDNLMINKNTDTNIELSAETGNQSYIFLSSLNDKIIAGLKGLVTQLKTKYNLNKKITYNRNYDCNGDDDNEDSDDSEYKLILPFNSDNTDNDQVKIFDSNKKRMSITDFKLIKNVHATFIVEPYIQINIGGDIDLQMTIHQIQIKDIKRKIYVINEYSFVESDDEVTTTVNKSSKKYNQDKLIETESEDDSESESESDTDSASGYKFKSTKKLDSDSCSESNDYLNKYLKTKAKH